ncbi:MAG TPA: hypothetical protein VMK66_16615 [Myxococcales bacterium]|nr:hypothetical protein [Myxococcales bacterium]
MRALAAVLLCTACIERPFDQPQAEQARAQVDRGALRDVLVPAPADATSVGAVFGNAAELVAYKLEPAQMVAGQRAKLTLYWRCRAEMESWHIFVHLDDSTGAGSRLHAEHDPAGGRFPTDAWKPGDQIADAFWFIAPEHPLLLYLGFYSQGENRLPLTSPGKGRDDGNNRLLAGVLPVAR